jgi:hypothetical protein
LLTLKNECWGPEELKADPRFAKVLQRIGYPQVPTTADIISI